ncbi:sphinganine hydroxylase Sur2 like protein [Zymoseptoria brevis]|uniref:Sphinganine hydroxylase Sur2 like protein n=1 Tax=Zymoseptoria brevis TaxID=1047168 RepID=A0A0F4GU64_9PEZI|nr:sphinganine hydroxylase Sur2 like protein [Zymoseptoria brevis]
MLVSTMANATVVLNGLPPLPDYTLRPQSPLLPGVPDAYTTLVLPIIAYWGVSMIFHCIDELDLFPQYRLHTPAEVLKRNHVSRWDVFRDVVIQQVIQTLFGLVLALIDPVPQVGREEHDVAWWAQKIRIAQRAIPAVLGTLGVDGKTLASSMGASHAMFAGALAGGAYPDLTQTVMVMGEQTLAPAFAEWELSLAKALYHLVIPGLQFLLAIMVVDTWQYFLHRAMHMNKWLYTKFHSRHHRLYVPYAYGALYNHPVEGFALDTLGTGIAYLVTGMSVRQSMWFFTMSTIKTVDDHCGYAFPWDPLQHITSNNAGYHDVHHQSWGIKTNFSQPFFTFWDSFLGTKWTGGDVSARYERAKIAAQKKVDDEAASSSITNSTRSEISDTKASYSQDAVRASPAARIPLEPRVPAGKPALQALASRQQVLDDISSGAGGMPVLVEENAEEFKAQAKLQQSPRKRTANSGLKGLADRMGESLHGRGTGVLGVEGRRR